MILTRAGRLPLSSFLCFVGGFSMGSWLTLFHQLQAENSLDVTSYGIKGSQSLGPEAPPNLFLLILIISAPENFDRRTAIRDTWLKLSPKVSVNHYFVIGDDNLTPSLAYSVIQEETEKADLLLLPLADSYSNLTLKMALAYDAVTRAQPSRFVLKVDDDSFARVDKLVEELHIIAKKRDKSTAVGQSQNCFYWGFFDGRATPKKSGKWAETEYNLCNTYIPYALGGGYVLSHECTQYISSNHARLRKFQNEDISVGTWLAPIDVDRRHDRRFDTEFVSRGCHNSYLVQHKISVELMNQRYNNLVSTGKLCEKEVRKRSSYEYNWAVPPIECCKRDALLY